MNYLISVSGTQQYSVFCVQVKIWSDIFQELAAEILGGAECRLAGREIVKCRKYSAMLNIN